MQAVERSGTLGHQVLASLRKQAQHLRAILGIYRRQPLVARGGQGSSEGIEAVVLAGVASEAREHAHARRKLRRHVHHRLA
jgi:anti-anti-sigma regulatory factor